MIGNNTNQSFKSVGPVHVLEWLSKLVDEEFAPLQKQRFQVCDDARGGGPEQAPICCNLSGNYEAANAT